MHSFEGILARLPLSRLRSLLTWLLVLLALWLAAGLLWQLLTPLPKPGQWQPKQGSARSDNDLDPGRITQYHLFGEAEVAPPEPVANLDAPETRLRVTLAGLVAASDGLGGVAIIESQGRQQTYVVGETIQGTGARLERILEDRVLVSNRGVTEALMLDGVDYRPVQRTSQPAKGASRTRPAPRELRQAISDIKADPTSIADLVQLTPERDGDELLGYRIAPGRKPELFKAVGLQSGDLVKALNGYDLTDPAQALEVLGQLDTLDSLSLDIDRNGVDTSVEVTLENR
ncbi:type II secretion system protein GspC [Gallaecimonas sp. GXIMD4217]|uniref:type II secretion system protein GspC n=1 Tax=Gallaecimonas sp. GXIMD4217 TaxID=3131927 RepID=UPI00311B0227